MSYSCQGGAKSQGFDCCPARELKRKEETSVIVTCVLLQRLARAYLLILDDWGLAGLDDLARRDLLEVLDDRYGRKGTLVASQLPVEHWHEIVGDATFADAILDRLIHNAHRITLEGGSMRRVYDTTRTTTTGGATAD